MGLLNNFTARCQEHPQQIVFPDAHDERVVKASRYLLDEKLAVPILIGSQFRIRDVADNVNVSTRGIRIITPYHSEHFERYVEEYYLFGREKGITRTDAIRIIQNPLWFAAMLVKDGQADLCIAGNLSTTPKVLRAALQSLGVEEGINTVSSFFLMISPGEQHVYAYADCWVIPEPTPEQLAEIAVSTAKNYAKLTQRAPKVALLSFSTKGSAEHPVVEKVRKALSLTKAFEPSLCVDGEIQFDAAIVPDVARRKAVDSPLQGETNVFIFPSLDAGNISYQLAEQLGGFTALGPFLQGLRYRMHALSRGCSVEDMINVALTASCM